MKDVVVVGGGAAGLSAALVLGRSRRRTLVVDDGLPRNAPSPAAHSVFTRDGTPPAELRRIARDQLLPYDTVELRHGNVVSVSRDDVGFAILLGDGTEVGARRVLLALGVRDVLPEIEGFGALWGRGVLHCPYCHGWEVRDEPLALYADGPVAMEMAPLLLQWSRDLLLCTGGRGGLAESERETLIGAGVRIVDAPVQRLEGDGRLERVVFADGSVEPRRALFVRPAQALASDVPVQLGCELTEAGLILAGADRQTSIPGVYAAGDAASPMQQILVAAAAGAEAAMMINRDLVRADFGTHERTHSSARGRATHPLPNGRAYAEDTEKWPTRG
jgi:thioredoxin reductase